LKISIVILNWNGRHFLEKYLPGVEEHSQLPDTEIIVADNASTDDSVSYLQEHHPKVRLALLDKNYGFAEGYNRALLQADADYFVLLNSDVEVTAGWLQPMLDMMRQKENIAGCMPTIRSAARPEYFEYAGAAGGFIDKYGYVFCRGRLFHTVEKDCGQYDAEAEVFWVTGACCMFSAKLFREAGGFDNQFFAHMEEIDLCWRLKNAGYTFWHTPRSTVLHVGGGTLPQASPLKTYLNYRNNLLMMYKNLAPRHRKRILRIRTALDYVSGIHSLLKGDISVLRAVCRAHRSYRKMRRLDLRQSDLRQIDIGQSDIDSCIYPNSVVYQYFIKGRKRFEELSNISSISKKS